MININTRIIFDRKNETKGDKDKSALLQIEVRLSGTSKRVFFSTGKKVTKKQFTYSNGNFTCKDRPDATAITAIVRGMIRKINDYAASDQCKHLEDIRNYDKEPINTDSFIDFIKTELRKRDIEYSTIKQHLVVIGKLEAFEKIRLFSDLTYENISDFDDYLRKEGLADVTIHKRHSIVNIYTREALKKGKILRDPYSEFKVKRGKFKDPVFLSEDEVESIKNYQSDYAYLERTRDLYLFQCYTGLSYVDLIAFSRDSVSEVDGLKVIRSNRLKTDENYITLFLPEAQRIAEKYQYDLPKLTNQKYNQYLKKVATNAGINKNLTSHSARHTFATYLINNNIPIETVSKALGHTNTKQTERYAKLLGKKIINDMKKLL